MRDAAASMAGSTAHEPVPWFDALYRQGWPRLVRLAWVFTGRHDVDQLELIDTDPVRVPFVPDEAIERLRVHVRTS